MVIIQVIPRGIITLIEAGPTRWQPGGSRWHQARAGRPPGDWRIQPASGSASDSVRLTGSEPRASGPAAPGGPKPLSAVAAVLTGRLPGSTRPAGGPALANPGSPPARRRSGPAIVVPRPQGRRQCSKSPRRPPPPRPRPAAAAASCLSMHPPALGPGAVTVNSGPISGLHTSS